MASGGLLVDGIPPFFPKKGGILNFYKDKEMRLKHFDGAGHGNAAAAAQGGKAQRVAAFFHGMDQGDHDSCACCAYRMAKSDAGAVDVGDLAVQAKLFFTADVLGRKGFVDLDQFEIPDFMSGFFK